MADRERILTTGIRWGNSAHTSLVITFPKAAADALKLKEGDEVDCYLDLGGTQPELIVVKRKD